MVDSPSNTAELIGSLGVFLLLAAFVANAYGRLTKRSRINEAVQRFKLDMVDRSRWNDCTIMVVSEFGRRNFENGSDGTDHGHGNVFFVTGGRVQGQQIVGDMQNSELTTSARYLGFDYDFREVYADLLADLGADPALIFPESYTNTGDIALY